VIRRLTVPLPATPGGAPGVRILAVSDELDPSLWEHFDRTALGPVDVLVSCGDLPPDYLSYLEGSLRVPLLVVVGNHDLDDAWRHQAARLLPARRGDTELVREAGQWIALLDWPGGDAARDGSQERGAWRQAIGVWLAARLRGRRPTLVASHVAPHDAGDTPDPYHRGFRAYRWLAERVQPALWLHGHTTPAVVAERVTHIGSTTCVNVTGAYLIQLG